MQILDGYGITYESNNDADEAPNIFAGVVHEDAAYIFAASAVGIASRARRSACWSSRRRTW